MPILGSCIVPLSFHSISGLPGFDTFKVKFIPRSYKQIMTSASHKLCKTSLKIQKYDPRYYLCPLLVVQQYLDMKVSRSSSFQGQISKIWPLCHLKVAILVKKVSIRILHCTFCYILIYRQYHGWDSVNVIVISRSNKN